jgi:hypothetical protein
VRPSIADESKILSGWRDGDDVDAAPRRRASAIIAECDAAGAPGAREPFARLKDGPAARLAPDEEAERLSATPAPPGAPGRWVQRASLPIARSEMNWAAAWAGRMHVIGGYGEGRVDRNYHQVYDPATDRWFVGAPLPRGANHVAVAAFGGRVYALGGFIEQNRHSDGNAYAYDVATDRWTTIAPLSRPRGAAGAVALAGHIHVIGGATEPSSERASIGWHEAYDPQADRWQGRKPLPGARDHLGIAVYDEAIHVIGGRFNTFEYNTGLHHRYIAARDTWEVRSPLPTPHARAMVSSAARYATRTSSARWKATTRRATAGNRTRRFQRLDTRSPRRRLATGSTWRGAARSPVAPCSRRSTRRSL